MNVIFKFLSIALKCVNEHILTHTRKNKKIDSISINIFFIYFCNFIKIKIKQRNFGTLFPIISFDAISMNSSYKKKPH